MRRAERKPIHQQRAKIINERTRVYFDKLLDRRASRHSHSAYAYRETDERIAYCSKRYQYRINDQ